MKRSMASQMANSLSPQATERSDTTSHRAIPLLVLVHVTASPIAAACASPHPAISSAIFISLVFCQTSLIGLWGGLGLLHWMLRLLGMAATVLSLGVLLANADSGPAGPNFLLLSLSTGLIALVTWITRLLKARLGSVNDPAAMREGLQFSIKHLMLLTFVVALLVSVGKVLAPYVVGIDFIALLVVLSLCFVVVALTSIWAILGTGHPIRRIVFVPIVASIGGCVPAVMMNDEPTFLLSIFLLQGLFLVLSLFVVRKAGYRLLKSP